MSRRRARLAVAVGCIAMAFVAVIAWAVYWPDSSCSDPVCARSRFAVFVELDALSGVAVAPLELDNGNSRISVQSILATGGIGMDIVLDQTDLPYDPAAGKLSGADLVQLTRSWRNREPTESADAKLYALMAPGLISNTGEDLFGLMFDTAGREGFAVAPLATMQRFSSDSAWVPVLQMRTFVHELLHALNRGHLDAMQIVGSGLTIEAPTKCIADTRNMPWSLNDSPLLALSPDTIRFFQTAAASEVLPGITNQSYRQGRSSANECDELRERSAPPPARSRWALAVRRLKRLSSFGPATAHAEEPVPHSESGSIALQIQALPSAYPLGYPVAIRLIVTNESESPIPLRGRLNPSYGIVQIDTRAEDRYWQTLQPMMWFEPSNDREAMVEPGERIEHTVPIYFSEAGWTFAHAGAYEVRARLKLGDDFEEVMTAPLPIQIAAPTGERDIAALALLLDAEGQLDPPIGRLLSFGGRIGEPSDLAPVRELVEEFGDTALGAALRLTIASQQLRRPLDPTSGSRPPPDIAGAKRLLANACTDSGVAALRHELLESHAELASAAGFDAPPDSQYVAWDGLARQGSVRYGTYSDPALAPVGPSIHFCVNERRMRNEAWFASQRLARSVLELQPERVVIVGHTDDEGGCGYNDDLGLLRAESVKNVLINAGVRRALIQTATLGKRRPLDFAAQENARRLNRRVEVLVEANAEAPEAAEAAKAAAPLEAALPLCVAEEDLFIDDTGAGETKLGLAKE